ncbi:hypothetical protein AVENLUH5627_00144 [Acinetobacter venetianus]|uniref:Uncharacterized protein n=1 Tax=Acinetobacter venetianus TaxID=52133 RepID=A0A150I3M4_9GAMM|nr:hypothetical protein [Acinetobacter venetianus]KXZ74209.1 hypothetical protein AVENLUH5627_00144 [Acinetobacter venetianus]
MSNLTEHKCAGKCPEFRGEQCHHCLIAQVEKREFELGVAPDSAYFIGIDLAADEEDKSVEVAYCVLYLPKRCTGLLTCTWWCRVGGAGMRSEFENSIKWSSSYEKLVYQHGERLFIFDDGKYKIAAVQLAWAVFKEKQTEVDELQKRINDSQDIIESILARSLDNPEIQDLCGQLIDVLEKGIKGGAA